MDAPPRLSFLSYAVNGSGLGHLVRQVAIQRWLRRYCAFCGTRSAHWFLTTSEADSLLHHEGFAGFKLPSKTVVEESGIGKLGYIQLAKQWVWNSIGIIKPDVLLVDTFPNGSFHELVAALDLVPKKALVLRPVKEEFARRAAFGAMLQLYDRVVVPAHEAEAPDMAESLGLPAARVRFTGPLFRLERHALRPRADARARLGIPQGARTLLVSGGGGGDPGVEALFDDAEALLRDARAQDLHVVFAAGPLFRGRPRHGARRTWLTGVDLAEHLAAIDVAVCAAGFNTFHELAFAGVATVFVPQLKVADDQAARALALAVQGAARVLQPSTADQRATVLADAVLSLLDDEPSRARLSDAARALYPHNHARDAAREVLALVMPKSLLRQAVEVVEDALLEDCVRHGVDLGDVVDVALALSAQPDRAALELEDALELFAATRAPPAVLVRSALQLQKKVRGEGMADALARLLTHRSIEGQWSALELLLQALSPERVLAPEQLANELVALVEQAAVAGLDVFAAARLLGQTRAPDDEGRSTNRAAILAARTRALADLEGAS